jgi:glycogen debranching enzyme
MTIEAHSTAAGVGHPPAEVATEAPSDALVNLAETIVLKEQNLFAVTRRDGSIPVGVGHPLGVYCDYCRFLSGHELCINAVRPRLLVASDARGSASVHELTNAALPLSGGRVLPLQTVQLRLERRITGERELCETLLVHSYDRELLELAIELRLAADFEPMLAIRGIVAPGRGRAVGVERLATGLRFATHGRDGRHRATTVDADRPSDPKARAGALLFRLALAPGRARRSRCDTRCTTRMRRRRPAGTTFLSRRPRPGSPSGLRSRPTTSCSTGCYAARCWTCGCCARASTAPATTPRACPGMRRCFGRDSLIAASQMLAFDPAMGEQTLRVLAGLLGTRDDPDHDEEPGKVLQELRVGGSPGSGSARSPATTARSTRRPYSSAC